MKELKRGKLGKYTWSLSLLLHFGAGRHQIVTKTFGFRDRIPLGIEICVLVAHGCSDRRMPEQLLGCHSPAWVGRVQESLDFLCRKMPDQF
jgi:hypothetical protein